MHSCIPHYTICDTIAHDSLISLRLFTTTCILQEDGTKAAASTYLIDQIEYPYPYPTYEMQHQPKPHHDEQDVRNAYSHGVDGK
jgi:hypothetical protein